jgi:hypothetical protein
MCLSAAANPTPIFGGTFVPALPVDFVIPFMVDAAGGALFTAPGGLGPATVYMQVLLVDSGLAFQLGFTNAVKVNALP